MSMKGAKIDSGMGGNDYVMRRAEIRDLDGVERIVLRAMVHPWSRAQLESAFTARGTRTWVISDTDPSAERPGVLVGAVLARRVVDLVEVDLVAVDPDQRRKGHARALLDRLLGEEAEASAVEARLELAASNSAALALYQGAGFVVVGERERYYPDGANALLLTRSLAPGSSRSS